MRSYLDVMQETVRMAEDAVCRGNEQAALSRALGDDESSVRMVRAQAYLEAFDRYWREHRCEDSDNAA